MPVFPDDPSSSSSKSIILFFIIITLSIVAWGMSSERVGSPEIKFDSYPVLEGIDLTSAQINALSRPIGSLSGYWVGSIGDLEISLDLDSSLPHVSATAPYGNNAGYMDLKGFVSRRGRVLEINKVTCLKHVSAREWALIRSDCPLFERGSRFILHPEHPEHPEHPGGMRLEINDLMIELVRR